MARKRGAKQLSPLENMFQTALTFHEEGNVQRAEHLYREVLRQSPEHAGAHNMLGVIGCQTGHLGAGIELIRKAIILDANNADYHNNLGMALLDSKQPAAARLEFEQAVALRPRFAAAHFNLANLLREADELESAETHYRKALKADPEHPDSLNNLGNLLRSRGKPAEASQLFNRLTRRQPDFAFGHYNLGLSLQAQQQYDEAIDAYRRACELDKSQVSFWEALGTCYRQRGSLNDAIAAFDQALALDSGNVRLLLAAGMSRFANSQVSAAEELFARATTQAPDSAAAANCLGMARSALGDLAGAVEQFERAVTIEPQFGDAYRNLAALHSDSVDQDQLLARILAALAEQPEDANRSDMEFALGSLYDERGEYDIAFDHYKSANNLRKQQTRFDAARQHDFIDAIIGVFSKAFFEQVGESAENSEKPVFIVGLPRSGTTLVEQIIASHSLVTGGGELTFFPEHVPALPRMLESNAAFPFCVPGHVDAIRQLSGEYLARLEQIDPGARYVTDKMPYNFLYLGIISLLFPRARIIHCKRNPMATCFSIYVHDLAGSHPYAYDLQDLASAYNGYERLMSHWTAVLPMRIFDIEYESLTADPASMVPPMIEFLDLDWEPACLESHRNERPVVTASQWQVRRPIYTASRDRWRSYAQHLGPLRDGLHTPAREDC